MTQTTILYFGGAGDARSRIVCGYVGRCSHEPHIVHRYFQHSEGAAALRVARRASHEGERLIFVGHSWGADTAARTALRLGAPVDLLVGVDPVAKLARRGLTQRSAETRDVITVEGGPRITGWGDVVKTMGVFLGRGVPQVFRAPDTLIHAPSRHDSFARMLHTPGEDGVSAADLIDRAISR